jgi:hypothetical protein
MRISSLVWLASCRFPAGSTSYAHFAHTTAGKIGRNSRLWPRKNGLANQTAWNANSNITPAVSGVFLAKDHHSCVSAPSETTLVWFYYYCTLQEKSRRESAAGSTVRNTKIYRINKISRHYQHFELFEEKNVFCVHSRGLKGGVGFEIYTKRLRNGPRSDAPRLVNYR